MKSITLVICTACIALWGCGSRNQAAQPQQSEPAAYPVMTVQRKDVTLQKTYPVTIRGEEDIEIRPRVDGFIKEVFIDEGSVVNKGQVLFTIDSPASVQAYQSARAAVADAQATVATARLNVERMQPLAEKNIISNVQLETYRNQLESAQAAQAQAEATLRQSSAALSWASVKSPVDGVAGEIPYRQGSLVGSSNVLTTIASTGTVYVYFSMNEKELLALLQRYGGTTQQEKIDAMPEVTLVLADGTVYPSTGRIGTISGVVDTGTGSANIRADFPNPDGLLRSGMSGRIQLPDVVSDVFEIPQKATFSQQDKTLVYKLQGDSVVQAVITVEATPDGLGYAVTSGLEEGDTIVSDGIATLTSGKRIKPQRQDA